MTTSPPIVSDDSGLALGLQILVTRSVAIAPRAEHARQLQPAIDRVVRKGLLARPNGSAISGVE